MPSWQAADAKQGFGRLIAAAQQEPQVVLRHAEPVGVVLSVAHYERLAAQADERFARFLVSSPLDEEDFDKGVGSKLSDG